MTKYVALLRGINISGKNKIAMPALKKAWEALGYQNVISYINSGNLLFESDIQDHHRMIEDMQNMIKDTFGLEIPVLILTVQKVEEALKHAPDWWGCADKEIYHNILFIIPPTTYQDVFAEMGPPKPEYEKISHYENVIFWSFRTKDYSKTNWIKTASSKINDRVTIRTARTMKKLLSLSDSFES